MQLVISDDHPGLTDAIAATLPGALEKHWPSTKTSQPQASSNSGRNRSWKCRSARLGVAPEMAHTR